MKKIMKKKKNLDWIQVSMIEIYNQKLINNYNLLIIYNIHRKLIKMNLLAMIMIKMINQRKMKN